MKKIAIMLLAVLSVFVLISCGDKEEITAEKFQNYFEGKGFEVYDTTEDWEEEIFKQYLVAGNENYVVEFVVFTDEDYAETSMDGIESGYSVKTTSTEVSSGNYRTVTFNSDDKYIMMTRVGKTVMFAEVDSKYKDEISKHFDELGYK